MTEDERLRRGSDRRPIDHHRSAGQARAENQREPAANADRRDPRDAGRLDPYHPGDPGEASAHDSPVRPKAPAVHQASEDGELVTPASRTPRPQEM